MIDKLMTGWASWRTARKRWIFLSLVSTLLSALTADMADAAVGAGTGPNSSWNEMQTFEYNVGRIAGALELCRRYDMAQELRAIADLTPYGKLGMQKMRTFDAMGGCGSIAKNAKSILGDKDKLIDYLKAKYICGYRGCVER